MPSEKKAEVLKAQPPKKAEKESRKIRPVLLDIMAKSEVMKEALESVFARFDEWEKQAKESAKDGVIPELPLATKKAMIGQAFNSFLIQKALVRLLEEEVLKS